MTITPFGALTKLKRQRTLVPHRLDFLLEMADAITTVRALIHTVALAKFMVP
jgi:hypothetical protein